MDIFERASRERLRFPSSIGHLTTEQLWQLSLTERGDRPDLDKIARTIYSELKSLEESSFVNVTPDPRKTTLELKLEVVKHVIASKIADAEEAKAAHELAQRKRKLLAALASKEEAELAGMSREQIEAEIARLAA